ncbi:MAG: competence protein ComEC [Candidatus Saganbacteria bacterium]|uniref:Competence protein ComEC n=1 Tax=Candidatus Saganbacteria bacterium TaxID=2575572 RepID=A0A833L4C2_UNCSA|nr:MAG: competence protein ComEC [Candidatus Saganbacteria bacterium]
MFKRPLVLIAIIYALLIILIRPQLSEEKLNKEKFEVPAIKAVNEQIIGLFSKTMPKPFDSLLGSIIFGSGASPIDNDLKEEFRKVGLIHLLVASGTQVSILIGVSLALLRYFNLPIGMSVAIISIINIMFAVMAGLGASIIRAGIMGEITLIGLLFNRESEIYTSMSLAALILMIVNPLIVFDLGFQLTFLATWALIYLAPKIEKRLIDRGYNKILAAMMSVSLAPILVTTPITLYNFNQFSIISFAANALVVPWVELLTITGFISSAIGFIFPPISGIINNILYLLLILLREIVFTFSKLPGAFFYVVSPPFIFILYYYVIMVLLVEGFMDKIKKKIALLVLICLIIWTAALSPTNALNELKISVIDVGQGDSIFIESPSGKNMLVDGGPKYKRSDAGIRYVLPFLHKKGINKIDIMVLTHPHDDHLGGLPSVIKDLSVGLVMDSGQAHTSKSYLEFLKLIDSKNIPYKLARAGMKIDLGEGVIGEILHPSEPLIEKSALNNNSVVIRLSYKKFSILLAGDAEREGEERILKAKGYNIKATILKAGHHGSKTSSSSDFIKSIKIALISVGEKNRFSHPHPSTIKRLNDLGIKYYRTDLNGNILVKTDGNNYIIETQK